MLAEDLTNNNEISAAGTEVDAVGESPDSVDERAKPEVKSDSRRTSLVRSSSKLKIAQQIVCSILKSAKSAIRYDSQIYDTAEIEVKTANELTNSIARGAISEVSRKSLCVMNNNGTSETNTIEELVESILRSAAEEIRENSGQTSKGLKSEEEKANELISSVLQEAVSEVMRSVRQTNSLQSITDLTSAKQLVESVIQDATAELQQDSKQVGRTLLFEDSEALELMRTGLQTSSLRSITDLTKVKQLVESVIQDATAEMDHDSKEVERKLDSKYSEVMRAVRQTNSLRSVIDLTKVKQLVESVIQDATADLQQDSKQVGRTLVSKDSEASDVLKTGQQTRSLRSITDLARVKQLVKSVIQGATVEMKQDSKQVEEILVTKDSKHISDILRAKSEMETINDLVELVIEGAATELRQKLQQSEVDTRQTKVDLDRIEHMVKSLELLNKTNENLVKSRSSTERVAANKLVECVLKDAAEELKTNQTESERAKNPNEDVVVYTCRDIVPSGSDFSYNRESLSSIAWTTEVQRWPQLNKTGEDIDACKTNAELDQHIESILSSASNELQLKLNQSDTQSRQTRAEMTLVDQLVESVIEKSIAQLKSRLDQSVPEQSQRKTGIKIIEHLVASDNMLIESKSEKLPFDAEIESEKRQAVSRAVKSSNDLRLSVDTPDRPGRRSKMDFPISNFFSGIFRFKNFKW